MNSDRLENQSLWFLLKKLHKWDESIQHFANFIIALLDGSPYHKEHNFTIEMYIVINEMKTIS